MTDEEYTIVEPSSEPQPVSDEDPEYTIIEEPPKRSRDSEICVGLDTEGIFMEFTGSDMVTEDLEMAVHAICRLNPGTARLVARSLLEVADMFDRDPDDGDDREVERWRS